MRDEIARSQREAEEECVKLRGPATRPGLRCDICEREFFAVSTRAGFDSDCGPRRALGKLDATRFDTRSIQEKKNTGVFVSLISYLPTTFSTLFALGAGLLLGFIQ
jgi:hypothetical protein